MAEALLSSGQVESIARALGEVVVGPDISRLLSEAKLTYDSGRDQPGGTKWRRLADAFTYSQRATGSSHEVLRLIKLILHPTRHLNSGSAYEEARRQANEALAFSGFRVDVDGRLLRVTASRTVDEAKQRADRLRARLQERKVHPDVLAFCKPQLTQHNYFHAVLEATKSVADKIRTLTGLSADASTLVQQALSVDKPALMVNDLSTEPQKDEQKGLSQIAQGMFVMFRNVTAHAPQVSWAINEDETLDVLVIASMLHRRLDTARLAPAAPLYRSAP